MTQLRLTTFSFAYERPRIDSVEEHLRESLQSHLHSASAPALAGKRVALAVGSRGIGCLEPVVRSTVSTLTAAGASVFIVPAMGSHGGATASGQEAVLAGYGITRDGVGAPVRASMETVELESTGLEHRLYVDRIAWEEADFIVPINRVKIHTSFSGTHGSGLLKMLVIGLGKHDQAKAMHALGVRALRDLIPIAAQRVLDTGRVPFGVAIVENAWEEPAVVEVVAASDFVRRDAELLTFANRLAPRLPTDRIDLLIVDEIGKDKSGTGIDTNVIGRRYIRGEQEPETPDIGCIFLRRLSRGSHGNALGMGLADIVHRDLADAVDFRATYENVITSTFIERAKLPLVVESDAEAVSVARHALHLEADDPFRVVHIKSTLELDTAGVSDMLVPEVSRLPTASPGAVYDFLKTT